MFEKNENGNEICLRKPLCDDLNTILTSDKKLYLFGEENFSFTKALVKLIKTDNVVSTTYANKRPTILDIKIWESASPAVKNGFFKVEVEGRTIHIKKGIDATKTDMSRPEDSKQSKGVTDVAWFQCPFVAKSKNYNYKTQHLVDKFLRNMKTRKIKYVLIGIVNHRHPFQAYGLKKLLAQKNGCKYIGVDDTVVGQLLAKGYVHNKTGGGTNTAYKKYHATLIFTCA